MRSLILQRGSAVRLSGTAASSRHLWSRLLTGLARFLLRHLPLVPPTDVEQVYLKRPGSTAEVIAWRHSQSQGRASRGADMELTLVFATPGARRHEIPVTRLPAVVGRGLNAEVCVGDPWASREHCEIYELDGEPVIRDLKSKNGTFVNGRLVVESILLPNSKVTVGRTSFWVQYRRKDELQTVQAGLDSTLGSKWQSKKSAAAPWPNPSRFPGERRSEA